MGRRPVPIADTGPLGVFARELVKLKATVPGATYRSMAKRCNFSHAVLADAAGGKKLPTWEVVKGFVTALGIPDEEVEDWEKFWIQTRDELVGELRRVGGLDVVVPVGAPSGGTAGGTVVRGVGRGRLRPVMPDLAEPAQTVPRPEAVRTYDDLVHELGVLRIHAGNPSLSEVRARMQRRADRHGRVVTIGKSTLGEVFSGRRTPGRDAFLDLVDALLHEHRDDRDHVVARLHDGGQRYPQSANVSAIGSRLDSVFGPDADRSTEVRALTTPRHVVAEFKELRRLAAKIGIKGLTGESSDLRRIVRRGWALAGTLTSPEAAGMSPSLWEYVRRDARSLAGIYFADDVVPESWRDDIDTFSTVGLSTTAQGRPGEAYAVTLMPARTLPDMMSRRRGFLVFSHPGFVSDLFALETPGSPGPSGNGPSRWRHRTSTVRRCGGVWGRGGMRGRRPSTTAAGPT